MRCADCQYSYGGMPNALNDICDSCRHDADTGFGGYINHSQEDEYGFPRHHFGDDDNDNIFDYDERSLKMFTCCLCGKTYAIEKEVVKCVNRCGRALPHKDKKIPSYEIENVISDLPPQDFLNQLRERGVSNAS